MKGNEVFKYGLILSAICVLYFSLTNIVGVSGAEWAGWTGYAPYLIVVILALFLHDPPLQSYKSRFLFGTSVSFIAALISSLFMYLYLVFVDDLMIRTVIENEIATRNPQDPDYRESVLRIRQIITPVFYLIFGTIMGTVIGLMTSAIFAIFIKPKAA